VEVVGFEDFCGGSAMIRFMFGMVGVGEGGYDLPLDASSEGIWRWIFRICWRRASM
jgi:hypothetical protein